LQIPPPNCRLPSPNDRIPFHECARPVRPVASPGAAAWRPPSPRVRAPASSMQPAMPSPSHRGARSSTRGAVARRRAASPACRQPAPSISRPAGATLRVIVQGDAPRRRTRAPRGCTSTLDRGGRRVASRDREASPSHTSVDAGSDRALVEPRSRRVLIASEKRETQCRTRKRRWIRCPFDGLTQQCGGSRPLISGATAAAR
jgi:hypothetical protein